MWVGNRQLLLSCVWLSWDFVKCLLLESSSLTWRTVSHFYGENTLGRLSTNEQTCNLHFRGSYLVSLSRLHLLQPCKIPLLRQKREKRYDTKSVCDPAYMRYMSEMFEDCVDWPRGLWSMEDRGGSEETSPAAPCWSTPESSFSVDCALFGAPFLPSFVLPLFCVFGDWPLHTTPTSFACLLLLDEFSPCQIPSGGKH